MYSNSSKTAVDIKKSKQLLGDELTQSNLARHTKIAFCWITYSITRTFEKSRIPKSIEDLFISIRYKDILQAGEKILLRLLGKRKKSLDELPVHKYHEKMSGQPRHAIKVEARGPTSDDVHQKWGWDCGLDTLK